MSELKGRMQDGINEHHIKGTNKSDPISMNGVNGMSDMEGYGAGLALAARETVSECS
jgi:hypothetical protein